MRCGSGVSWDGRSSTLHEFNEAGVDVHGGSCPTNSVRTYRIAAWETPFDGMFVMLTDHNPKTTPEEGSS